MICTTGADPISVTCQVTIIPFIGHLINKELKNQGAGTKKILTVMHAMTLSQEAEIMLKRYEGPNDDDKSVMKISTVPHSEMLTVQGQSSQPRKTQSSNQIPDVTVPRQYLKGNLTCYKNEVTGLLTQECSHTGSSVVAQNQQTPIVSAHHISYAGPTLFPATISTVSQTITVETQFTAEVWQTLMK